MKKLLIALFMCSALYAEGFYSAGSFSYDPIHTEGFTEEGDFFRTSVLVGGEIFGLYAEAEQNTDMIKSDLHMFSPNNSEYYVRAGYRFRQVYVEYEHLCIHGIDRYDPQGGHDRFTIGFDTRYEKIRNP